MSTSSYFPTRWPAEDGGPTREQTVFGGGGDAYRTVSDTVSHMAIASTMVIHGPDGQLFLLSHTGGSDGVSWIEQLDPTTLAPIGRSAELPGGPAWPGGVGVHANGDLYVVFGRHAHRLRTDLSVVASVELPRHRPYNSFVLTSDGVLITKDFGGALPGAEVGYEGSDTDMVALSPDDLSILARVLLPEASIARLSAEGSDIYMVGVSSLWRVTWNPDERTLAVDDEFTAAYREEGEGYGWDPVLSDGRAWFLNNGAGSERFDGSLFGHGIASAPQQIISVDTLTRDIERFVVNDQPGGLVANPPAVDPQRQIVVGYDSGNAVVTAWRYGSKTERVWTRHFKHAAHPLVLRDSGAVVLGDFVDGEDFLVVVDIETGEERSRAGTASPLQSVLFPAPGFRDDLYYVSFFGVSRIAFGE